MSLWDLIYVRINTFTKRVWPTKAKFVSIFSNYSSKNSATDITWTTCTPDADQARNLWGARDFSSARILPWKKEKKIGLQIFSQIEKTMQKLQWITMVSCSRFIKITTPVITGGFEQRISCIRSCYLTH